MDIPTPAYQAAVQDWNDACRSAIHRIEEESGKSLQRLAVDFGVRFSYLERVMAQRANFSRQLLLKAAVATSQNPVRMLAREALS